MELNREGERVGTALLLLAITLEESCISSRIVGDEGGDVEVKVLIDPSHVACGREVLVEGQTLCVVVVDVHLETACSVTARALIDGLEGEFARARGLDAVFHLLELETLYLLGCELVLLPRGTGGVEAYVRGQGTSAVNQSALPSR